MNGVTLRCAAMPFWWTPDHPSLPDVTGHYLASYDPGHESGAGWEWTPDATRAKVYPSAREAMEDWRAVNPAMPRRPTDGQPNRPLTMFTVEVA